MAVPSEPSRNIVSSLSGVPANDVLDGSGCDVSVVRSSCGERRPIVESVRRKVFGLLQLQLESVDLRPVFQGVFFLQREVDPFRSCIKLSLLGLNSVRSNIDTSIDLI